MVVNSRTPALIRILSVPAKSSFGDLHRAIAASFGWTPLDNDPYTATSSTTPTSWSFAVVIGDPVYSRSPREARKLLQIYRGAIGTDSRDASQIDMKGVFERFQYRGRDLLYNPCLSGSNASSTLLLGIKLLGRASEQSSTLAITCLGGQGRLDTFFWDMGESFEVDAEIFDEELSQWGNWDADFPKVNARLRHIQRGGKSGSSTMPMMTTTGKEAMRSGIFDEEIDDADLDI